MKKLIILGSGGYGRTVQDVATQLGYKTTFLDDSIPNHPLSSFTDHIALDTYFISAFGNNTFRMQWIEKVESAGGQLATLIHPTAYVSPTATVAHGTVILPKAVVNTGVTIQRGCILNLGAMIDHGCIIEEGCHICLGAIVKGDNRIPAFTKIEAGVVVEARQWPIT